MVVKNSFFVFVFVVAGVAHRLHSKHGKNVVLLGDGCQAGRVGGYAHGIVFSAKELKTDELFEVRNGGKRRGPGYFRSSLILRLSRYRSGSTRWTSSGAARCTSA